jgi:hypothetical protein
MSSVGVELDGSTSWPACRYMVIYACINTYIHIYIHIHTCAHTCNACLYIYIYIYTYIYIYIYTYDTHMTHRCILTYKHRYMHKTDIQNTQCFVCVSDDDVYGPSDICTCIDTHKHVKPTRMLLCSWACCCSVHGHVHCSMFRSNHQLTNHVSMHTTACLN